MTKHSLLHLTIFISALFLSGCVSYPTVDSQTNSELSKRDKFIRENLENWRSQLFPVSNGGLVVVDIHFNNTGGIIRTQGSSPFNVNNSLTEMDNDNICIWFWRKDIPLLPEILSCEFLEERAVYMVRINSEVANADRKLSELRSIISNLNNALEELEKKDEELSSIIKLIESNQVQTRGIADSSRTIAELSKRYSQTLVSILSDIQKIAKQQKDQISDLAKSRN